MIIEIKQSPKKRATDKTMLRFLHMLIQEKDHYIDFVWIDPHFQVQTKSGRVFDVKRGSWSQIA